MKLPPAQRSAVRCISGALRVLQEAFAEESAARGLTEEDVAQRLGVPVAQVKAVLEGERGLTLRLLGEYAWAMGRRIKISAEQRP